MSGDGLFSHLPRLLQPPAFWHDVALRAGRPAAYALLALRLPAPTSSGL